MDKFMDSPWFLRLTALMLALILFFSVQAEKEKTVRPINGDTMDIIQDVPVEVYYDKENLVVTGVPDTVEVKIEGPANLVQSTKLMKDFSVLVDLTDKTIGEHEVAFEFENMSDKLKVKTNPDQINVTIEEKLTVTLPVEPEMNEQLLAEDHFVESIDIEPKEVQVTGPKSAIDAIQFVKVTVTGEKGITKPFKQVARVRVLDSELNKLNVEIEPEEVSVNVIVDEQHKKVPILIREKGEPKEGVELTSIEPLTKMVKVYGTKPVLEEITEVLAEVDVSKVTKSGTYEVTLIQPEQSKRLSFDKVKVDVQVAGDTSLSKEEELEPSEKENEEEEKREEVKEEVKDEPKPEEPAVEQAVQQKTLNVPVQMSGLLEGFEGELVTRSIAVHLFAKSNELQSIVPSSFRAVVDLSSVSEPGTVTLPLRIEGPNTIDWKATKQEAVVVVKEAPTLSSEQVEKENET